MTLTPNLPVDPLARFRDLYEALNEERRWWRGATPLRFAAIAALTCPGQVREVAASIRRITANLRAEATWFGRLDSRLRFIVAATLLAHGDHVGGFLQEVKRVRAMFRRVGLRRAAAYETIAILVLRMQAERAPITDSTVHRFLAVYEEMKRHHWWLTGPDDFPVCAILTGEKQPPAQLGREIEETYQSLRRGGFSIGDPLQRAANILYLAGLGAREAARRYLDLAESFRKSRVAIWRSDYDELAILTFLDHPVGRVVDRVLEIREAMKSLRPRPPRTLTFNLAASITFLELVRMDRDLKVITDVKALLDMQAIINAQRAAAAGAGGAAASS